MKIPKFSHKTPHLKRKQHQLDPNLDLKQLVHHATVQYVDRDADGDVDVYDNPKKPTPDENPIGDFGKVSKELIKKQKGEIKHTKRGLAYEDLRKWFSKSHPEGNWKRYNTKGEAIGPCAREPGEPKPKCLSNEKAAKMSKDEIAASVKRKREKDPVADRKGKGGKPIMSSNKIDEGLLDRLRGKKVIGRTGSGGKIYASSSKKSTVTYGGKTQDEIRTANKQKKADTQRKDQVKKGTYDDPWLKSSPAAERRVHYQQLRGEAMEERRYCMKCKKMETRDECSYGPEMWDKMTIKGVSEAVKKSQPDHEHSMARSELSTIEKAVKRIRSKVKGEGNIEAWVQSKITKAADYIDAAADYLDSGEHNVHGSMDEEKNKCPEGQYFCNRENKCKPIPKGYHLMPNGAIMKDDNDHEIDEAKGPCWTGYKQVGMKKKGGKMVPNCVLEETNIEEENKPTNPKLWAKWKAKAKAKFDVYPSAYANGWAAKGYKSEGGGWKSVKEELEETVRIPAKTGNIILVTLNWRAKYYMIKMFFPQTTKPSRMDVQDQINKVYPGAKVQSYYISDIKPGEQFLQVEDWQSVNRKDKTDGLSQKAVSAYRRENPGSKLQTAVTEKKPEGKRAERRKSFCRRMSGMKSKLTSAKTARDPDSRINKALRRWNCN